MRRVITTNKLDRLPPSTPAFMFDEAAGVECRADVRPPFSTFGTSVRYLGPVLPEAIDALDTFATELQRLFARHLRALVFANVWRKKLPGEHVNRHAEGRAFDLAGVWWNEIEGLTAADYGKRRKEAIAVEACLRLVFPTVLGPASNRAHGGERPHWHVNVVEEPIEPAITEKELADSKRGVRKVEVVYLQDACNTVHGIDVGSCDGWYGPKTSQGVNRILSQLDFIGSPEISNPDAYQAVNIATALVGAGQLEKLDL